jgi:hypothetical protein
MNGFHEKVCLVVKLAIYGARCERGTAGNISDRSLPVPLLGEQLGGQFDQQCPSGLSLRANATGPAYF